VLFAGAASLTDHPSGSASLVVLALSELTLIEAVTSGQALEEARRNLRAKVKREEALMRAHGMLDQIVHRSVRIVRDPLREEVAAHDGKAHWKDLPLLTCALREVCSILVTFNVRDYQPGDGAVEVMPPGTLVRRVRRQLSAAAPSIS
jgi:hypothetical protein